MELTFPEFVRASHDTGADGSAPFELAPQKSLLQLVVEANGVLGLVPQRARLTQREFLRQQRRYHRPRWADEEGESETSKSSFEDEEKEAGGETKGEGSRKADGRPSSQDRSALTAALHRPPSVTGWEPPQALTSMWGAAATTETSTQGGMGAVEAYSRLHGVRCLVQPTISLSPATHAFFASHDAQSGPVGRVPAVAPLPLLSLRDLQLPAVVELALERELRRNSSAIVSTQLMGHQRGQTAAFERGGGHQHVKRMRAEEAARAQELTALLLMGGDGAPTAAEAATTATGTLDAAAAAGTMMMDSYHLSRPSCTPLRGLQSFALAPLMEGHHGLLCGPRGAGKRTAALLAAAAHMLAAEAEQAAPCSHHDEHPQGDGNATKTTMECGGEQEYRHDNRESWGRLPRGVVLVNSDIDVHRIARWLADIFGPEAFAFLTIARRRSSPLWGDAEDENDGIVEGVLEPLHLAGYEDRAALCPAPMVAPGTAAADAAAAQGAGWEHDDHATDAAADPTAAPPVPAVPLEHLRALLQGTAAGTRTGTAVSTTSEVDEASTDRHSRHHQHRHRHSEDERKATKRSRGEERSHRSDDRSNDKHRSPGHHDHRHRSCSSRSDRRRNIDHGRDHQRSSSRRHRHRDSDRGEHGKHHRHRHHHHHRDRHEESHRQNGRKGRQRTKDRSASRSSSDCSSAALLERPACHEERLNPARPTFALDGAVLSYLPPILGHSPASAGFPSSTASAVASTMAPSAAAIAVAETLSALRGRVPLLIATASALQHVIHAQCVANMPRGAGDGEEYGASGNGKLPSHPVVNPMAISAAVSTLPLERVRAFVVVDADRTVAQLPLRETLSRTHWMALTNAVDVECQFILTAERMASEVVEFAVTTLLPDVNSVDAPLAAQLLRTGAHTDQESSNSGGHADGVDSKEAYERRPPQPQPQPQSHEDGEKRRPQFLFAWEQVDEATPTFLKLTVETAPTESMGESSNGGDGDRERGAHGGDGGRGWGRGGGGENEDAAGRRAYGQQRQQEADRAKLQHTSLIIQQHFDTREELCERLQGSVMEATSVQNEEEEMNGDDMAATSISGGMSGAQRAATMALVIVSNRREQQMLMNALPELLNNTSGSNSSWDTTNSAMTSPQSARTMRIKSFVVSSSFIGPGAYRGHAAPQCHGRRRGDSRDVNPLLPFPSARMVYVLTEGQLHDPRERRALRQRQRDIADALNAAAFRLPRRTSKLTGANDCCHSVRCDTTAATLLLNYSLPWPLMRGGDVQQRSPSPGERYKHERITECISDRARAVLGGAPRLLREQLAFLSEPAVRAGLSAQEVADAGRARCVVLLADSDRIGRDKALWRAVTESFSAAGDGLGAGW